MDMDFLSCAIFILVVCGVYGRPPKEIIGSDTQVVSGDRPYQVALYRRIGNTTALRYVCGGTILDEIHILTAAHCVNGSKTSAILVAAGCVYMWDAKMTYKKVIKVDIHPKFRRKIQDKWSFLKNDIAILTINSALVLGGEMEAVKLPSKNKKFNVTGEIAGWGCQSRGNISSTSGLLLKTEMIILKSENCGRPIPKTQFCAINSRFTATCGPGDSGSAFIVKNIIVGILSSGKCFAQLPTYFTNVFAYLDFIRPIIENSHKTGNAGELQIRINENPPNKKIKISP